MCQGVSHQLYWPRQQQILRNFGLNSPVDTGSAVTKNLVFIPLVLILTIYRTVLKAVAELV